MTSRYPLWDVKSPELTAEVPHSKHGDERSDLAMGGKHVGAFHDHMSAGTPEGGVNPHAHQESTKMSIKTAEELGHSDAVSDDQAAVRRAVHDVDVRQPAVHVAGHGCGWPSASIIVCAALMTSFLYAWLTSPLEPHHP